MRLIDADEAIKALGVAYFDKGIQSAKDDPCVIDAMTDWAIRQIKAMPTIGGWVPCSERLPDACGKYLVTMKWNDDSGDEHITIKTTWYGEWDGIGWGWAEIFDIVAWMPLPEPYSIESDGIEEETDE